MLIMNHSHEDMLFCTISMFDLVVSIKSIMQINTLLQLHGGNRKRLIYIIYCVHDLSSDFIQQDSYSVHVRMDYHSNFA